MSFVEAPEFRLLRLIRLSKLGRISRLVRFIPELQIMIKGMVAAARSVFVTLFLLLVVLYIFAIAFKQLSSGSRVGSEVFTSVGQTMYILVISGTLLDEVGELLFDIGDDGWVYPALFLCFVLLGALTIMNLLIGVLCEAVSVVAAVEKEELILDFVHRKLRKIMMAVDENTDETVCRNEFMQILENHEASSALRDIGVDAVELIEYADHIFEDDSPEYIGGALTEKRLTFTQLMSVVLQFRGTNAATVRDIVDLRKFVRTYIMQSGLMMQKICKKLELDTVGINEGIYS